MLKVERRLVSLVQRVARVEAARIPPPSPPDPAELFTRAVGSPADPWQVEALRSQAKRELWLCSRQVGKSSTAAAVAMWTALYQPGLILCLSPSERQSTELYLKIVDAYNKLGQPVPSLSATALQLRLANGARVVALPGEEKTIRSFSGASLLLCDEASRIPDSLYFSVRPMLAVSGGRLIGLSTPFGKRGWFHDAWHDQDSTWRRVRVTAEECPRISAEFLEEERRSMGDWWYRQEYECQFTDTLDQVFSYDQVMGAMSADVAPLFGE